MNDCRCGEGDWVDAFSHCREWRRDPVEGMGDEGGFFETLLGNNTSQDKKQLSPQTSPVEHMRCS